MEVTSYLFGRVPLNPWLNIGHDIHAEYVMIMLSLSFSLQLQYMVRTHEYTTN
jgi:hypothetical protein